jgi:hypothetical protein
VKARDESGQRRIDGDLYLHPAVMLRELHLTHFVAGCVPQHGTGTRAIVIGQHAGRTLGTTALKICKSRHCHHGKPQYQK